MSWPGEQSYKWYENYMKETIEIVRLDEMTIREVSERYCVSKGTLGDWLWAFRKEKK